MFVCLSAAFAVENMRNHIKIVFLFGQTKLFYTFAASFSRTVLADVLPVNLKKYFMAFTNNIMIVRHRLLTELVKLWKKNELIERIDRLPIELSPRRSKHEGRCCVHKERAV